MGPRSSTTQPLRPDLKIGSQLVDLNKEVVNPALFLDPKVLNDNNLALRAKYERMKLEDVRYEAYNLEGDYGVLIVSYGTMSRVCKTAVDELKSQGIEVGLLRPQTLFPFPEDAIFQAARQEHCHKVLCVEMSMGQMLEDVQRSVQGCCPVQWYGKCGGDVPTPEEIIDLARTEMESNQQE